ncbi:MAG: hypothetical protein R3Y10_07300 [Ferrimonas sp.]
MNEEKKRINFYFDEGDESCPAAWFVKEYESKKGNGKRRFIDKVATIIRALDQQDSFERLFLDSAQFLLASSLEGRGQPNHVVTSENKPEPEPKFNPSDIKFDI